MYPNLQEEMKYASIDPIEANLVKPSRPSIAFAIVGVLALLLEEFVFGLSIYVGQDLWRIIVNGFVVVFGIFTLYIVWRVFRDYKVLLKTYNYIKEHEDMVKANPAVQISKMLAYHSRHNYKIAKNLAVKEYLTIKQEQPDTYDKLLETLPEDTKTCQEILRIVFQDPAILKAIWTLDREQSKLEDIILIKYNKLLKASEEERNSIERSYIRSRKNREGTRKYNAKRKQNRTESQ